MAAEPTLKPTVTREHEQEEYDDEGEESDVYEIEGDEEADIYEQDEEEEEEEEEADERLGEGVPENMTALLLGKQNGATTTTTVVYDEEDEDEDEEYLEDGEGTAEDPIDLSPGIAGSKRGADELTEGDASGEEDDDEAEEKTANKKARV